MRGGRGENVGWLDRHNQFCQSGSKHFLPGWHGRVRNGGLLGGRHAHLGRGVIMYSGAISPTIVCGSGVTPIITSSSAITES